MRAALCAPISDSSSVLSPLRAVGRHKRTIYLLRSQHKEIASDGDELASDPSHEFLLKLATFRPSGPVSRRSGRLARVTPYSVHAYEEGAGAILSLSTASINKLLSIEQLAFIATAFVSANHKRTTTTALLTRIGDLIASRLNDSAQTLSLTLESASSLDGKSLNLISSSAIVTSFARVGLKHSPLFTAVSFWAQGSMRFKSIRPRAKANMMWLTALLWAFSQVGFYDEWLWKEASLLLQGDPVRWFKLMDADDCLKMAWSMTRVQHNSDPALMQLLMDRMATQVGKLSMDELGSAWAVLANISKRGKKPPSDVVLLSLSKASRVKINSIKPTTLTLICTSLATLMDICPSCHPQEGFWKSREGPPHSISDLLNAVAVWSSNKALNFKPEEVLALLTAMSSMGYRNPWALKGICRKLVMPRKLAVASSHTVYPPLIKLLSNDQLLVLLQCLSSLDHYSSSLLTRILLRLQSASEISPSCLIKALQCLVQLRHSDFGFLDHTANRLLTSKIDPEQRNDAFLMFALLGLKKEEGVALMGAHLFDQRYFDERATFLSASDQGRGMKKLDLLIQSIEKQLMRRLQTRTRCARLSTQDVPSISCYSFFPLDHNNSLFADIAVPSSSGSGTQGKGLAVLILTELDFMRFWPGGEIDRSSPPLTPMAILRMKLIRDLGWEVRTIKWQEWMESKELKMKTR